MGAYEIAGDCFTLIAAADHSAKRYFAVVVDSDGKAAIAGADKVIAGVLQTAEIAGRAERVMRSGITFGILGGTVEEGDNVSTDANGKFVTADAGPVVGIALVGGGDGAIGTILLK